MIKKKLIYLGLIGILSMFCSCKLVREDRSVEGLAEEFTGMIHPGKYVYTKATTDGDLERAAELFLGLSEEEAWEYHSVFYDDEIPYFDTEKYFLAIALSEVNSVLYFKTEYENASGCYSLGAYTRFMNNHGSSSRLRLAFPDEDITSYTKKDAIEFCRPYAEYMGYDSENVEVYAVTLDILQSTANSIKGREISAPLPGYVRKLVTKEEWEAANASGDEDAIWQLRSRYDRESEQYPVVEWQEKDEAFILTYQIYYEGIPVESNACMEELIILYAPQYDQPVMVQASYVQEELLTLQADLPITSDDAVAKLLAYKGVESMEDIEIKTIVPIYMSSFVEDETLGRVKLMTPYWKIEYELKNRNEQTIGADKGTIRVDAVYGEVTS